MFPKTKFVYINSPLKQFFHVFSELWEVFKALIIYYITGNKDPLLEEIVDLMHTAQTMFYTVDNRKIIFNIYVNSVERKNENRGYYD